MGLEVLASLVSTHTTLRQPLCLVRPGGHPAAAWHTLLRQPQCIVHSWMHLAAGTRRRRSSQGSSSRPWPRVSSPLAAPRCCRSFTGGAASKGRAKQRLDCWWRRCGRRWRGRRRAVRVRRARDGQDGVPQGGAAHPHVSPSGGLSDLQILVAQPVARGPVCPTVPFLLCLLCLQAQGAEEPRAGGAAQRAQPAHARPHLQQGACGGNAPSAAQDALGVDVIRLTCVCILTCDCSCGSA